MFCIVLIFELNTIRILNNTISLLKEMSTTFLNTIEDHFFKSVDSIDTKIVLNQHHFAVCTLA
jgi:hypothetical protein